MQKTTSRLRSTLPFPENEFISRNDQMRQVFRLVEKAKDSDISILVQGESGTGKELIARSLHYNGRRKFGPFVAVNCASIPRDLLESELFGHERGAFTGAVQQKMGKFELADKGTLFLDEMGELDLSLQAKLLRTLELCSFERVGGTHTIHSDFRVVTASSRDLQLAMQQGHFREDLYFRLASFPIKLPALRERGEDAVLLANHFLHTLVTQKEKPATAFSQGAATLLHEYSWPGNVRELKHAVEYAVLLADSDTVQIDDLPATIRHGNAAACGSEMSRNTFPISRDEEDLSLESVKELAIRNALSAAGNNILLAAKHLRIARSTLYQLMKKYGITHSSVLLFLLSMITNGDDLIDWIEGCAPLVLFVCSIQKGVF